MPILTLLLLLKQVSLSPQWVQQTILAQILMYYTWKCIKLWDLNDIIIIMYADMHCKPFRYRVKSTLVPEILFRVNKFRLFRCYLIAMTWNSQYHKQPFKTVSINTQTLRLYNLCSTGPILKILFFLSW